MARRLDWRPRPASWRLMLWGGVALVLVTPAVAMRFTDAVAWTHSDFAAAGLLLGGGALALELVARTVRTRALRFAAAAGVVATVALVWAQGAVGVF